MKLWRGTKRGNWTKQFKNCWTNIYLPLDNAYYVPPFSFRKMVDNCFGGRFDAPKYTFGGR